MSMTHDIRLFSFPDNLGMNFLLFKSFSKFFIFQKFCYFCIISKSVFDHNWGLYFNFQADVLHEQSSQKSIGGSYSSFSRFRRKIVFLHTSKGSGNRFAQTPYFSQFRPHRRVLCTNFHFFENFGIFASRQNRLSIIIEVQISSFELRFCMR